jgi:4-aminobutyrate aminotransferase
MLMQPMTTTDAPELLAADAPGPDGRVPAPGLPPGSAALSPVLGRYFERTWVSGAGHRLTDAAGNTYLDFACGIAVTGLGHGHPRVNAAIHEQVDRLVHVSNGLGYLEPVSALAAALAATLPDPLDTVFFVNSGAEAVEAALKMARRVSGRPGYVAFRGAFHGRTFGAASVTSSSDNYRVGYEPLLPGVVLAPFPDVHVEPEAASAAALGALDRLLGSEVSAGDVAAVIVEPIQGEGGVNPAPVAFLRGLRERCDATGILLIVDEVQTGLARTGSIWAFEAAGIVPDVVCIGKALANGLPLAAMVSARGLQDRWGLGAHGSTFGGNPVACAAGLAVLATIADEGLVANAAARGAELEGGLLALAAVDPRLVQVRGRGLMIGVETAPELAPELIGRCADLGLLLLTAGANHEVVRWLPPLDVSAAEIGEALDVFEGSLAGA